MNAFAAAMGSLFLDPHISTAAQWSPLATGVAISVRIIVRRPETDVGVGASTYIVDGVLIDVRRSDVVPAEGDVVSYVDPITGQPQTVTVHALNKLDPLKLVQTVEAK